MDDDDLVSFMGFGCMEINSLGIFETIEISISAGIVDFWS